MVTDLFTDYGNNEIELGTLMFDNRNEDDTATYLFICFGNYDNGLKGAEKEVGIGYFVTELIHDEKKDTWQFSRLTAVQPTDDFTENLTAQIPKFIEYSFERHCSQLQMGIRAVIGRNICMRKEEKL